MRDVQATSCDFTRCKMTQVDAAGAVFDDSVFRETDMAGIHAPSR